MVWRRKRNTHKITVHGSHFSSANSLAMTNPALIPDSALYREMLPYVWSLQCSNLSCATFLHRRYLWALGSEWSSYILYEYMYLIDMHVYIVYVQLIFHVFIICIIGYMYRVYVYMHCPTSVYFSPNTKSMGCEQWKWNLFYAGFVQFPFL